MREASSSQRSLSSLDIVFGQIGGPMIAGLLADATGYYLAGFTLLAEMVGAGSLFFLLARKPTLMTAPRAAGR